MVNGELPNVLKRNRSSHIDELRLLNNGNYGLGVGVGSA